MKQILEIMIFAVMGTVLLWFGYTLFFRQRSPAWGAGARPRKQQTRKPRGEGRAGDPQACPVCSALLNDGELVSSSAFPSMNGIDRFMHIKGCIYCLHGDRDRVCPVCGTVLYESEILICRLYERPGRRAHVHVIGCTQCAG